MTLFSALLGYVCFIAHAYHASYLSAVELGHYYMMDSLPRELFAFVLKYLPLRTVAACACVSTAWHSAVQSFYQLDGITAIHLDFAEGSAEIDELIRLRRRGIARPHHISVYNAQRLQWEKVAYHINRLPLTSLHLAQCKKLGSLSVGKAVRSVLLERCSVDSLTCSAGSSVTLLGCSLTFVVPLRTPIITCIDSTIHWTVAPSGKDRRLEALTLINNLPDHDTLTYLLQSPRLTSLSISPLTEEALAALHVSPCAPHPYPQPELESVCQLYLSFLDQRQPVWCGSLHQLTLYTGHFRNSLLTAYLVHANEFVQDTALVEANVKRMLAEPHIYCGPSLDSPLFAAVALLSVAIIGKLTHHYPVSNLTPDEHTQLLQLLSTREWSSAYPIMDNLYRAGIDPLNCGYILMKLKSIKKSSAVSEIEFGQPRISKLIHRPVNDLYLAFRHVNKESVQVYAKEHGPDPAGVLERAAAKRMHSVFKWLKWGYPVYPTLYLRLFRLDEEETLIRLLQSSSIVQLESVGARFRRSDIRTLIFPIIATGSPKLIRTLLMKFIQSDDLSYFTGDLLILISREWPKYRSMPLGD